MKKLEKVPFIRMLDTLLNRRLSDAECTAFHASYEEFIYLLHSLTAQSCRSPLDLLHELARLQSSLMRLQERIIEKESPQASLLKSALLLTNFEIRLIFTRLRYPSIADPVSVEIPKSPLFLSELMILKQTIADGRWWLVTGIMLLLCLVIYFFCSRLLRLSYQPRQDELHPSATDRARSWSALSLLAAAIGLGLWQPAFFRELIDRIASL